MTTIAQQLKIKDFPFQIKDSNGNQIYFENSDGYWFKRKYDSDGNQIYYEDSDGYWSKREYDSKGNLIYCEDYDGAIIDKRPETEIQKAIELLTKEGLIVDGKILKN
jgi:spore maturation protein CgeB